MQNSFQTMAELAFTSLNNGHIKEAESIFQSMNHSLPDDAIGSIGLASIALAQGNLNKAINEIESNGINKRVNQHEAQKFLLIAAMLAGDNQKSANAHRHFIENNICPGNEIDQEKHMQDAEQFFCPH